MKRFLSIFLASLIILGSLSVASAEQSGVVTLTTGNIKSATLASGSELSYTSKAVGLKCGSNVVYDTSGALEGIYDVTFNYSTQDSDTGLYLAVYLGEKLATKVNITNTESTSTYADISVGTFELSPDSDIRVLCTSYVDKSIYLASITLTPNSESSASFDFRQYADNATYTAVEDGVAAPVNETDYYDSTGYPDGNAVTLEDGYTTYRERTQHTNEWTRYDIKGMKSGTYNVTIHARLRTATYLYFYIDEDLASGTPRVIFNSTDGNNGGSSYTLCENTISLTIPYGAEYLYVKSVNRASYVNYYDFEFVTDAVTLSAVSAKNAKDALDADLDLSGVNVLLNPGSYVEYDLSGVRPGIYDMSLRYSTYDINYGFYYNIYMGENLISKLPLVNTGGTEMADILVGTMEVKPDENLKIYSATYNGKRTNLSSITFTPNDEGDVSYDFTQYADNVTLTVTDGVASPVNEKDYYDTAGDAYTAGTVLESTSEGTYKVRNQGDGESGEWTKYDVKGIKSGTYEVTVHAGVRSASDLNFYVGDENALASEPQVVLDCAQGNNGGTSYTVVDNVVNITIPYGAEYLWVKSTGKTAKAHYYDFKFITDAVTIKAADAKIAKNAANEVLDTTGTTVRLESGSYVEYDLSGIKPGIYNMSLNYSTYDTNRGFYYNVYSGESLVNKVGLENTGGDTAFNDVTVGNIDVKENVTLKILCTSYNGKRTNLKSITLTPNDEGTVSYDFRQYADNVTLTVTDGVASPVNGTDYLDTEGAAYTSGTVLYTTAEGVYGVRNQNDAEPGEWTRYDISGVKSGIYEVTMRAAVRSSSVLNFYIGGSGAFSADAQVVFPCSSGNHGGENYVTHNNTMTLMIPENAEYMWVKSTGKTAQIHYYDFKYISDGADVEPVGVRFTSDEAGENEIAEIGESKTIYAQVSIGANAKATVVVAKYNSTGFVVDGIAQNLTLGEQKTFEITPDKGDTVKVFIWKDIDTTLIPLCSEGIIE